jgi:ATP/maltotriose-dependent transcriptional regulator MalT
VHNFHSALPLEEALGLSTPVAETLLWIAQSKTNRQITTILRNSASAAKKHVLAIFEKLKPETLPLARVLEVLSSPVHP